MVACGLAHHIHRGAFALRYGPYIFYVLFLQHHAHALLALVAYYLFRREGLVAYRECIDLYLAAGLLYKLRESVEVAACAMVVDRYYRVVVILGEGAYHVRHSLLHLGVGTLHGIQFYARCILSCLYRRHSSAAHADTVIVAAHNHYGLSGLGGALYGILGCCIPYTSGEHYHLVVGIHLSVLVMFECQERPAYQWLAVFVAEVRCSVRSFDEDLCRGLVEPGAGIHHKLPGMAP